MMLGKLYLWFWYHTEFWLSRGMRRPYTYIMRDWIFRHLVWATVIVLAWIAGVLVISARLGLVATILAGLSGLLWAHLIWGTKWIEGQMDKKGLEEIRNE